MERRRAQQDLAKSTHAEKRVRPRTCLGAAFAMFLILAGMHGSPHALLEAATTPIMEPTEDPLELSVGLQVAQFYVDDDETVLATLVRISPDDPTVRVLVSGPPDGVVGPGEILAETTVSAARRYEALLAVNGSFGHDFGTVPAVAIPPWRYFPSAGDWVDVDGMAMSKGVQYSEYEQNRQSLCIGPWGFRIVSDHCPAGTIHGLQGRQDLVRNGLGVVHANRDIHPRTVYAITAQGELMILTVSGVEDRDGLNYETLIPLLLRLGAVEAFNADGGGSTTLMLWQDGRYVSAHPAINQGRFRHVANSVIVVKVP